MRLEKPTQAGHSNNLSIKHALYPRNSRGYGHIWGCGLIVNKGCQVVHREIALRLLNSFIISFRIEVIQRLHHY